MSEKQYYLDKAGLQLYDILIKQHITDQNKVFYDTYANWESQPELMSKPGCIYIYSDWGESPEGKKVAGFKVGDGETLLKDVIFTDQMYMDHLNDVVSHVSTEDRENWNNKVSCFYIKNLEKLIFTK